jgi:hypothetical protein
MVVHPPARYHALSSNPTRQIRARPSPCANVARAYRLGVAGIHCNCAGCEYCE